MLTEQQIQVWKTWADLQRAFPEVETNSNSQKEFQEWWKVYFHMEQGHRLKPITMEPKSESISTVNFSTPQSPQEMTQRMMFMNVEDIIEFEEIR